MSLHNKWWSKCVSFTCQIWNLLIVEELLWSECPWRSDSMMEVWRRWRRVWRILKAASQSQSRYVKHFQLFSRPIGLHQSGHMVTWNYSMNTSLSHVAVTLCQTLSTLITVLLWKTIAYWATLVGQMVTWNYSMNTSLSHVTVTACQTLSTLTAVLL